MNGREYKISKIINYIEFNEKLSKLRICFNDGAIIDYYDIPYKIYREMSESKSVGTYYLRNLKKSNYKYKLIV